MRARHPLCQQGRQSFAGFVFDETRALRAGLAASVLHCNAELQSEQIFFLQVIAKALIMPFLQGVNLMGGTKPPKLKIEDDDKTYIQR